MSAQQPSSFRRKAAVSVVEMCRMVALSKTSFYSHVKKGVFPWPLYSVTNRRPFYTSDMQEEILTTRQTGLTPAGAYVLFYERREPKLAPTKTPSRRTASKEVMEGLKSLGMTNVTPQQVEEAIAACFPDPGLHIEDTVLLRSVYRQLRRSGLGQ